LVDGDSGTKVGVRITEETDIRLRVTIDRNHKVTLEKCDNLRSGNGGRNQIQNSKCVVDVNMEEYLDLSHIGPS